jgi:LAO/AO transport system kinase
MDIDNLLNGLEHGRIGAASKLISLLEVGNDHQIDRIMEKVYPQTGHSWVIGITGPPGAGKSSLLNLLILQARKEDKTVGAVLVDPTSPVSGGAVLGDRIRMSSFARDSEVFMRSMGSRGKIGGLAIATLGAVRILDYLKKDVIFVETVGTGQIEIDICDIADTVCLVLTPGAGDIIQALKGGIREVNDIYVVNKCDRPGAEETANNIRINLDLVAENPDRDFSWRTPICPTNSVLGDGLPELWQKIKDHKAEYEHSELRQKRKVAQAKKETIDIILRKLEKFFRRQINEKMGMENAIGDIVLRSTTPQRASEEIFSKIANSDWTLSQLAEGREGGGNQ